MAQLTYEDLSFEDEGQDIAVTFLGNFKFPLSRYGFNVSLKADKNTIEFDGLSAKDARSQMNLMMDYGFNKLRSSVTNKQAVYVNKYLGLPLIGSSSFGIVDRNSNILEVKPITGCNMNCIFCSVDEGLSSRKVSDIVIDKEYLVEELTKVISVKKCKVHIFINAQGEPTLYRPLPALIKSMSEMVGVKSISLITNGTFLTDSYIEDLANAGLTRLNISLNAISKDLARRMEGHGKYDVEQVKKAAIKASKLMEVVLAPVYLPGYNDEDLENIVKFAISINARVGIQNYLYYSKGRNPANSRQMSWDGFNAMLLKLEKKYNTKLLLGQSDFEVKNTKPLDKPFRKGQTIKARIICIGRYKTEAIASSMDRNITVTQKLKSMDHLLNKEIRLKITSDKHNIFFGKIVGIKS